MSPSKTNKKRPNETENKVNVGAISDVYGTVNIAGRDITSNQTTTSSSVIEINQLFDQLYTAIEIRPETPAADKEDLKAEVEEIQSTVTEAAKKNKEVEESFLSRRFRNIARVAPDVLDVVVATLGSPLAGLGVAAKKIAEKAKEDTNAA